MSDLFDVASEVAEANLQASIQRALAQAPESRLPANGKCHNCDEKVEPTLKYCDGHCRDDHEIRTRARARNA